MVKIKDIDFTKYPQVKRMRHHVSPGNYLPVEELTILPNGYPPLIKTLDWSEFFADGKAPSELDIGCGRGSFLMARSIELTDTNILGIEVRPTPVEWILGVIEGEKLSHCGVVQYSVVNGLPFIESDSIESVYYLFPDPWTKTRYQKRRAFNGRFLQEIHRVLKPGGKLYLATDVPDVHEHHLYDLKVFGKLNVKIVESEDEWRLPITNKQDFCNIENIPYFRIVAQK